MITATWAWGTSPHSEPCSLGPGKAGAQHKPPQGLGPLPEGPPLGLFLEPFPIPGPQLHLTSRLLLLQDGAGALGSVP